MNKMLQKIVTKYPWKCVDASVYHNKANANKMLHQILTKWTDSNKTNKIKKSCWLFGVGRVKYFQSWGGCNEEDSKRPCETSRVPMGQSPRVVPFNSRFQKKFFTSRIVRGKIFSVDGTGRNTTGNPETKFVSYRWYCMSRWMNDADITFSNRPVGV
jgi:hypothetical protein